MGELKMKSLKSPGFASALFVYLLSRLVIVLGFFFTTVLTGAVLKQDPLFPALQNVRAHPLLWLSDDAELTLPEPPSGASALFIKAEPVKENKQVEVLVEGETVQTLKLPAGVQEYVIPFAATAIRTLGDSHRLHITFHADAYVPQQLTSGASPDTRRLALAVMHVGYLSSRESATVE